MTVSASGADRLAPPSRPGASAGRIPLSFFGMPFALAGRAVTWLTLAHYQRAPATQPESAALPPAQPANPTLSPLQTRT